MASKSAQPEAEKVSIEELLDYVDKTLDRVKVLYEQYFLGIQKQPPTHVHNDVERKLRELMQVQIRNTGLRYRFATLQQKFGSYNSYWRRTLRQIENGTYVRNLSKISRRAAETGEEIPEEILAAMPKRMREQVKRDRERALAMAERRQDLDIPIEEGAIVSEAAAKKPATTRGGAHVVDDEGDFDIEAFFSSITNEKAEDTNDTAPAWVDDLDTSPKHPATPRSASAAQPQVPPVRAPAPPPLRAQSQPPSAQRQPPGQSLRAQSQPSQRADTDVGGPAPAPSPERPSQAAVPRVPTTPGASQPGTPRATTQPGASQPGLPRATSQPDVPPPATQPRPVVPPPAKPIAPARASKPNPIAASQASKPDPLAPSQASKPNPIAPGSSQARPAIPAPPSLSGPFLRPPAAVPDIPKPAKPDAPMRPPPGMNDADVNALYAKYVQAKELVGEAAGPGSYSKLLRTINRQAPKIMDQYKAKGVEFSVVVKDNQVVIKAKPKT